MGAICHRKVAVDIHPVVRQQVIDVIKRRARHTFRLHLRSTGMVGLNHVFRILRLL
jgi:hypothetical protein